MATATLDRILVVSPGGLVRRVARELEFGAVTVNETPSFRADPVPYGGIKESGNTKEGPRRRSAR